MLTSEEATGDGGDDDLKSKEGTHSSENSPALLVDCVDTNDMDDRAHCQQDGGADGLKEVETAACLDGGLSVISSQAPAW